MILVIFEDRQDKREALIRNHAKRYKEGTGYEILSVSPQNIFAVLAGLLAEYPEKLLQAKAALESIGWRGDKVKEEEKSSILEMLKGQEIVTLVDNNWENWYGKISKNAGYEIGKILKGIIPIVFFTAYDLEDIKVIEPFFDHFIGGDKSGDMSHVLTVIEDAYYNEALPARTQYDILISDSDWAKKINQKKGQQGITEDKFYLGNLVLRNVQDTTWTYIEVEKIFLILGMGDRSYLYSYEYEEPLEIKCPISTIARQFEPLWNTNLPNPFWRLHKVGTQIINFKHIKHRTRDYLFFRNSDIRLDIGVKEAEYIDSRMLILRMKV